MGCRYHGQIGANLILGGVDCTGNHLYTVGPYGSVNTMPYLAMGMWHNTVLQALFFDYVLVEFEFLWRYSALLFCRKWNGWFSVVEFPKINYAIYSLTSSESKFALFRIWWSSCSWDSRGRVQTRHGGTWTDCWLVHLLHLNTNVFHLCLGICNCTLRQIRTPLHSSSWICIYCQIETLNKDFKSDETPFFSLHFVCLYMLLSQLETAKDLVRAAIHAGIMSDLGSGSNIDICVITRAGVDYIRPYQESEYRNIR